jgi:glycosyltransferase involved in cell wall biosynthesis
MDVSRKTYFLINSMGGGGAERQISLLIPSLPNVTLVCLTKESRYNISTNNVILLCNREIKSAALRWLLMPYFLWILKFKVGIKSNDNVICFLRVANILGLASKLLYKTKYVVSMRSTLSMNYKVYQMSFLTKWIDHFILKYADEIITNSVGAKNDLVANFCIDSKKIDVIRNTIMDIELLVRQPLVDMVTERFMQKNKVLTMVNTLKVGKSLPNTLRVIASIIAKGDTIKLFILGRGVLLENLISFCSKLSLKTWLYKDNKPFDEDAHVYFLGFQTNPFQYVSRSQLFLFPSRFEGSPNALLEALLCGVTCIAADCPSGPRELLAPNTATTIIAQNIEETDRGILMPPFTDEENFEVRPLNSIESLWESMILKYIQNPELSLSFKKNTNTIANEYNIKKIVNQWQDLINSL